MPRQRRRYYDSPGLDPRDALPLDRRDDIAEDMLAQLEAGPCDEGSRMALSDRLDEIGPTYVDPGKSPNWMRLAVLAAYREGRGSYQPDLPVRGLANYDVPSLLVRNCPRDDGDTTAVLDHYGRCLLLGRHCFVTEPYCYSREALLPILRRAADFLRCGTPIVCSETYHCFGKGYTHIWRGLIVGPDGRS